jgi:hypothetical protein
MRAGQKHSIKIANRSFEGVTKLKYLGTIQIDRNCMREKIKSRINWGMLATLTFLAVPEYKPQVIVYLSWPQLMK